MSPLVVATGVLIAITVLPYVAFLALYAQMRPRGSPADKQPAEPSVSIVLPTYNEERIVERKLEDICSIAYPMEKLEVVVVDSSDDRTPELVESFFDGRRSPELSLLREESRRGLAIALNEAYAAASHEVVVKTDCDSFVSPTAVREAVANLADPEVGAVTGRNVEVLGGSEVEAGYREIQSHIQALESHLDSTLIFHGPFSAFENDEIVPIDADSIADDTELALKIRKNGKRSLFDPAIEYKEASHSEFGKRRRQKDRRAMGLLRLLWRNRDMVGGYGKYGRVVLPFNWWFMAVSPWLVMAASILVGVAAIARLGPWGAAVPIAMLLGVAAGARDLLGPLQPAYALFDTQISLFRAAIKLMRGEGSGLWDIDPELRDAYE